MSYELDQFSSFGQSQIKGNTTPTEKHYAIGYKWAI